MVGGHCRHSSKQRVLNHFLKTSQIGPLVAHILANVTYILTHLIYLEKHIFVILTRGRGEWSAVVIGTQLVSVFGLFLDALASLGSMLESQSLSD